MSNSCSGHLGFMKIFDFSTYHQQVSCNTSFLDIWAVNNPFVVLFCRFDPNNSKYGPMGVKYPDFDQNYPKCCHYAYNFDHFIM